MFEINDNIILRSSTPDEFKRGNEYYIEKRIKSVQFNRAHLTFDAAVSGTLSYDVRISFERSGKLEHTTCTCPHFEEYNGFCRHIIAVLLLIRDRDDKGFFVKIKPPGSVNKILSLFQNVHSIPSMTVNVEIVYELNRISSHEGGSSSSLSLSIGQDRMYTIKNIKSFFESLEKSQEIRFGKKFTFDPLKHCFSVEDKPLMDFLQEIYEMDKLSDRASYGSSRGSVFRDKLVFLTNSGVKRLFKIIKDKPFRALIKNRLYEDVKILDGDFPVNFRLTKEGSELALSIDFKEPLIPLTDDGEYFFAGKNIYRSSFRQQTNFKPFYLAMAYQQSRIITFPENEKERLVSEVLPFAENAGKVIIDEEISSMIEKLDLETEIYLDRDGDTITAEVRFVYGDRIINPFASVVEPSYTNEKIVLRDMEGERIILSILEGTDFKVRNNCIHLDGEENIYDFIYEVIPKLQEYASVYYSDNLKKSSIRDIAAYTGAIRLNRNTDMLEFSFNIDGIDRSELGDILEMLRMKKKYYRLKDGTFLNLNTTELHEIANVADYLSLSRRQLQEEFIEIPKYRALYMDQYLKKAGLRHFKRNHDFKELVENISDPEDTEIEVPVELNGILREYQKFGFKWLKTMASFGLGAILADDMGLGKTLQVIALILADKKRSGTHPSLVIAPTSLVYNWYAEIEKFAPGLRAVMISGNKNERQKQMECIRDTDIVITSYPLIRRDIEEYRENVFRYCILDEAQHIKNPASINAHAVKKIKAQNRLVLTGTPMENSLTELWSIFDFIMQGYLFSHAEFVERYERPIIKDESNNALEELSRHIKPFVLRRLKSDVLNELPEKIEHEMVAELTSEQKKVYLAYLQQIRSEIQKDIQEQGFERSQIRILAALTRLRQICCHPSLFLGDFEGESGKMLLLQEIIQDTIDGGHRALLFSQFTSMLHIIEEWLKLRKIEYLYLDGSTKAEDRGKLVKAFNEGQGKVFLISLKAGGTGLNLTGADTVIHYDPWWNPAVEDQATDRAYRIGQTKAVHVMKLITRGTIEDKIFNLQQKKKKLIDAVIQPGETLLSKMSEEEVRALFE